MTLFLELVAVAALVLLNGFFVGAEFEVPAALEPLECSLGVEGELARLRVYRWKAGEVRKSGYVVEGLAADTAERWDAVRRRCTEAERFWRDFLAAEALL